MLAAAREKKQRLHQGQGGEDEDEDEDGPVRAAVGSPARGAQQAGGSRQRVDLWRGNLRMRMLDGTHSVFDAHIPLAGLPPGSGLPFDYRAALQKMPTLKAYVHPWEWHEPLQARLEPGSQDQPQQGRPLMLQRLRFQCLDEAGAEAVR